MRKLAVVALVLSCVVGGGLYGAPREGREAGPRERVSALMKRFVKLVGVLGDGLTIPGSKTSKP